MGKIKLVTGCFKIGGLILVTVSSFAQVALDTRFRVKQTPSDSITIPDLHPDQAKRDSIIKEYSNWHEGARALEKYLLKQSNPGISRDTADLIVIKLKNGKKLTLVPDKELEEVDYIFQHHFKKQNLLLFRVQWPEGNHFAFIDQITGKKTYLTGYPVFSPDNKFLMAINCDLEAGYSPNGFELFEVSGKDFKKIWQYTPKVWGPVTLIWTDNTTIVSKNLLLDDSWKYKTTFSKIKITEVTPK